MTVTAVHYSHTATLHSLGLLTCIPALWFKASFSEEGTAIPRKGGG